MNLKSIPFNLIFTSVFDLGETALGLRCQLTRHFDFEFRSRGFRVIVLGTLSGRFHSNLVLFVDDHVDMLESFVQLDTITLAKRLRPDKVFCSV